MRTTLHAHYMSVIERRAEDGPKEKELNTRLKTSLSDVRDRMSHTISNSLEYLGARFVFETLVVHLRTY